MTTVTPIRSIYDRIGDKIDRTVDFVDSTGDKVEVDFVASVYDALGAGCPDSMDRQRDTVRHR